MSEIKRVQFTTISTHTSNNFGGGGNTGRVSGGSGANNGISGNKFNDLLQNQQLNEIGTSISLSGGTGGSKTINNNINNNDSSTNNNNINNNNDNNTTTANNNNNNNNNNNDNNNSNNNGSNDATTTAAPKCNKTFRHKLELFEPDSESFPEFNFSKLMHIEKKKQKKLKQVQTNGISTDPFEENDDDVARIAKEMEMKYGKSYVSGRRKTKHDDLCDKGLGYDESDSFIDNTEAYDELIPDEVETIAGGFYINSGQLEFKKLTKYEIETEEIVKMVKSKKRVLSTSSEESEENEENDMVDLNAEFDTDEKSIKKSKQTEDEKMKNGHRDKKQKSSGEESSSSKTKIKTSKKSKEVLKNKDNNKSGDDGTHSDTGKDKPTLKTTTVKDMLKTKRDNYLKMQDDKKSLQNGIIKSGNDTSESTDDESDSDAGPSKKKCKTADDEDSEKLRSSDTKLPEDLSKDLLIDISELIDTAKSAIKNGKKFQFDEKSCGTFLKFDDNTLCLEKDVRNQVFAHLEFQMQLPKYYLIKKGKQIRIKQEKTKIKKAYVKLKNSIAKVMPSVINSFDATCKQVADLRSKASAVDLEKPEPSLKFPRKKFPWNDSMRNLLFDLYQTRWTSYTVLRTRKEKFEDFVNSYLREKVVPIWPSGWMKLEELQKELEKRKNQAKKSKDFKKSSSSMNPTPAVNNDSGLNNIIDVPKEILTSTTTLIPPVKIKSEDESLTTDKIPHLSSVTISSPPTANSKPNFANEVPQKLSENSISIIPVVQESITTKSQNALNVVTNNNNNVSIDKVPSSNSNNVSNNNKVDKSINSSTQNSLSVDLISPTKRTDHSISSIISNTSPTPSVTTTTTTVASTSVNRSNTTMSSTTHVINVDDFKNSTDIIQTSNKLLNSNNNNDKASSSSSSSSSTSSSSSSNNSSGKKKETKSKKNKDRDRVRDNNTKSKGDTVERKTGAAVTSIECISIRRDTIESISSSSDSVEFIDEKLPALSPPSSSADKKIVTVNKNKYIKIKKDNKSRSASPVAYSIKMKTDKKYIKDNIILNEGGGGGGSSTEPPPPPSVLQSSQLLPPLLSGANENDNLMMRNMNSNSNFSKNNFTETKDAINRCDNETNSESGSENKDSDLDVKQLIEQIKDLGEMNPSKIDVKKFTKEMKNQ